MTFKASAARGLVAGAALTFLAVPALADCAQEIEQIDAAVIGAETGAATGSSTGTSTMPASPHQEQVLSGEGGDRTAAAGNAQDVEESDMPSSPHQEQVLSGDQRAAAGAGDSPMVDSAGDAEATSPHQREAVRELDDDTRSQAASLVGEARELSAAGDEQGCLTKLQEAKALLGTK